MSLQTTMIIIAAFVGGGGFGAVCAYWLIRARAWQEGYLRGYKLGKSMEFSFWLLSRPQRDPLEGELPEDFPGSPSYRWDR